MFWGGESLSGIALRDPGNTVNVPCLPDHTEGSDAISYICQTLDNGARAEWQRDPNDLKECLQPSDDRCSSGIKQNSSEQGERVCCSESCEICSESGWEPRGLAEQCSPNAIRTRSTLRMCSRTQPPCVLELSPCDGIIPGSATLCHSNGGANCGNVEYQIQESDDNITGAIDVQCDNSKGFISSESTTFACDYGTWENTSGACPRIQCTNISED